MGATVRYIEDHFNCYLYAPESFEWLLLKVMFSKDPMIYRILKNPSDYTESTKYLTGRGILRMYWKNIRRGQNWNITRKN